MLKLLFTLLLLSSACTTATSQSSPTRDNTDYRPLTVESLVDQFGLDPSGDPGDIAATMLLYARQETEGRRREEISLTYADFGQTSQLLFTVEGLADDSVQAQRYLLDMTQTETGWQIDSAGIQTRCAPNRGHQDWSSDSCL